jgi:uncharacterized membrane protein YdjX (TVP38/TMEM64 family)
VQETIQVLISAYVFLYYVFLMKRGYAKRYLIIIITALLVPILPFVMIGELPGERWLSAFDDNALLFGIVGSSMLVFDIVLPIPSSIVGTILGARLGFWLGFLFTWVGLIAGNLVGFLIARFASSRFRSWLPPFPKTTTQTAVFLSRPVPVVAEAVALAAGATRMPLLHFFVFSVSGNAIYAAVLNANGSALLPDSKTAAWLIIPMLLPALAWISWNTIVRKREATT